MIPIIDGKTHHFIVGGVYDGVFVAKDTETGTLWNHVTGEGMYGPLADRRIPVSNLLQMNVEQALAIDPKIHVAISNRPFISGAQRAARDDQGKVLSSRFLSTMGPEDTRRPRMELGLGVWTDTTRRFYPLSSIRLRGEAFLDEIDGRTLLVYVDPEAFTPAALFVNANEARLEGQTIQLDTGAVVRSGVLLGPEGRRQQVERPNQLFTRWYGFALTFPAPDVFGG